MLIQESSKLLKPSSIPHFSGPLNPPFLLSLSLSPSPRLSPLTLQQAINTLQHIDWCLHQLESVDSAKAMGGALAQDKFHRLLTRELSHMSEHSKSGNKLAEWVHDITGSTNGTPLHTPNRFLYHTCMH